MKYTQELSNKAKELNEPISLQISGNYYLVFINNVILYTEDLKQNVNGLGTTLEDACYDFIRKSRGCSLYHLRTEQKTEVL